MKKIILGLLLCTTMVSASAQVTRTTVHHRYYYYSSANVYFDEESGNYWYWDTPSSQWKMVRTLPADITLVKSPKYQLRYEGDDPWKKNADDVKKYKVKKNGRVKVKLRDR